MLKKKTAKSGFTLIELSFAIAFISVLLVTITLITVEIISAYRKGLAIKTVNTVGRDLIEDFTNTLTGSPPATGTSYCDVYSDQVIRKRCEEDGGNYFIYQEYRQNIYSTADGSTKLIENAPVNGVFCTGSYSYVWNTGYLFNDDFYHKDSNATESLSDFRLKIYNSDGNLVYSDFRLLKIKDTSRSICATALNGSYPSSDANPTAPRVGGDYAIKLSHIPSEDPIELLPESENDIALFDMTVYDPAQVVSNGRLFYSASFILGTIKGGVNIMTSSSYCDAPSSFSADFSYCAINKFNFSTQASGS